MEDIHVPRSILLMRTMTWVEFWPNESFMWLLMTLLKNLLQGSSPGSKFCIDWNQEQKMYAEVAAAICEERVIWREDDVPVIRKSIIESLNSNSIGMESRIPILLEWNISRKYEQYLIMGDHISSFSNSFILHDLQKL
uniref:Uncharacterized protein n=1 Tax=Lactuca sativa TaxID=4236 RepID=A0A9R1WEN2_LACSA|nr:hypothetical protein LSAT_V11C200100900 [Lactuca sativa]